MQKSLFGHDPAGASIWLFRLRNAKGIEVAISNYGGIVQSILLPDRNGRLADVVLGFDNLEGYVKHPSAYFGALLGRYASRIGEAAFHLGGRRYDLASNHGRHSLHGGRQGFDKRTWTVMDDAEQGNQLRLAYRSADGEEGYPGELEVQAIYSLNDEDEFRLDLEACTSAETVINLTDHSDFNLAGDGSGDVLGHRLTITADRFLPVGEGLVPTGELRLVADTAFDFRESHAIGDRLDENDEQVRLARGYDHTFALTGWNGSLQMAARVHEPRTGRVMELHTTQPGIHFYSGNFLDGSIAGKSGRQYGYRGTFYLGAQHFPDAPNQPSFPSTVLKPGEVFRSTNLYRFSVDSAPEDLCSR